MSHALPIYRATDHTFHPVPVKYEQVVFCGLSEFQLALYRLFITSPEIKSLLRGTNSQPLKAINILKKLCNHPELLDLPNDLQGSEHLIPEGFCGAGQQQQGGGGRTGGRSGRGGGGGSGGGGGQVRCDWSGKFVVLERFLQRMRTTTTDKIVLISNYTQTLDLFEKMLRGKR